MCESSACRDCVARGDERAPVSVSCVQSARIFVRETSLRDWRLTYRLSPWAKELKACAACPYLPTVPSFLRRDRPSASVRVAFRNPFLFLSTRVARQSRACARFDNNIPGELSNRPAAR